MSLYKTIALFKHLHQYFYQINNNNYTAREREQVNFRRSDLIPPKAEAQYKMETVSTHRQNHNKITQLFPKFYSHVLL